MQHNRNCLTHLVLISTIDKQWLFIQKIYHPLLLKVAYGVDSADRTRNKIEANNLNGLSIFWGGLVRIDVLKVFPSTRLTFYGSKAIQVHMVPTAEADEFYQVRSNVVEPALQRLMHDHEKPVAQEVFLEEFKKVVESIAQHLKEQPVIVAHTENTFDGSGIKRLLTKKYELDKSLDAAMELLPKDPHNKLSKEYLRVAIDTVAPTAGLPPFGVVDQMDTVVNEVFKMVNADDGKLVDEDELMKLML